MNVIDMVYSRISRLEEKRSKKQLILSLIGLVALIVLTVTVGIPLLVQGSVFIGNLKSRQPVVDAGDKTPPFPPTLSSIVSATNSATLKLDGFAEPDSTLILYVNNDEVKKTLLDKDGTFNFADIQLEPGTNSIYAIAEDASGNKSDPSQTWQIVYKKDAPKLQIDQPTAGQTFPKDQQEIEIKGSTDTGVAVTINDRFVSVKDDGSFVFRYKLSDGENTLNFLARDPAGNETKSELKVTYQP